MVSPQYVFYFLYLVDRDKTDEIGNSETPPIVRVDIPICDDGEVRFILAFDSRHNITRNNEFRECTAGFADGAVFFVVGEDHNRLSQHLSKTHEIPGMAHDVRPFEAGFVFV